MPEAIDILARPTYGMAQVDWILQLKPNTARRWIDGYTRRGKRYPPIVRPESTGDELVTWGEFVETRLLSEFRSNVSIARMRPAIDRLREMFNRRYPLAHARPLLDVSGRELVIQMQQEVGLDSSLQLVVVRNDQLVLTLPAHDYVGSADFGETDVVQRIRPVAEIAGVWLDPLRQFGEPTVRSVPTAVIAEQVRAGDEPKMIAELYDLSETEVLQAVRYELHRGREQLKAA